MLHFRSQCNFATVSQTEEAARNGTIILLRVKNVMIQEAFDIFLRAFNGTILFMQEKF